MYEYGYHINGNLRYLDKVIGNVTGFLGNVCHIRLLLIRRKCNVSTWFLDRFGLKFKSRSNFKQLSKAIIDEHIQAKSWCWPWSLQNCWPNYGPYIMVHKVFCIKKLAKIYSYHAYPFFALNFYVKSMKYVKHQWSNRIGVDDILACNMPM